MADLLDLDTPCWEWPGARTGTGYGVKRHDNRNQYTHRLSYEAWHGLIPDGLEIDHLCRNPGCMNPLHLEAVTHRENTTRGKATTRATHCPKGHIKAVGYGGAWMCKTCHNARSVINTRRRRAAARG